MNYSGLFGFFYSFAPHLLLTVFLITALIYRRFISDKGERTMMIFLILAGTVVAVMGFMTYIRVFFIFNNIGW